jgi:hypothetical protein
MPLIGADNALAGINLRSSARLHLGYRGCDEISGKEIPVLHL